MKLFATTLTLIALSTIAASANEQQSAKQETTAKNAKVVVVKAPFKNHWDANAWEKGSADNFWSAKTAPKKDATPAKAGK